MAALRLTGIGGDPASLGGSPAPAKRWLALPALPPTGGRSFLLLQNAGRGQVDVSFRLIGSEGPSAASIRPRAILPGRTIRIILPAQGSGPLSALVIARGGTIVAAVASYPAGRAGYAATLALPMN